MSRGILVHRVSDSIIATTDIGFKNNNEVMKKEKEKKIRRIRKHTNWII